MVKKRLSETKYLKKKKKKKKSNKISYISFSIKQMNIRQDFVLKLRSKYILGNNVYFKDTISKIENILDATSNDQQDKLCSIAQEETKKELKEKKLGMLQTENT